VRDDAGGSTEITVIAGSLADTKPQAPPPDSWASRADADVAIWSIRMTPGATWTMPATRAGTNRTLYFFRGEGARIGERSFKDKAGVRLRPELPVTIVAGVDGAELLLLQGRPIGEPVVQYGPFVMNTPTEIEQAFADYRRTQFGGWPWPKDDPVHGRDDIRFARHADGRIERADGQTIDPTALAKSAG
jgi:redox-sensitive bicupin YhaK (pirin superfamily)